MSNHECECGNSTFTAGLIVGGIIGIALGLLYAPQAGEETRARVKETLDKARDEFGEPADRARQVKRAATRLGTNARRKIKDVKGKIETQLMNKAERDSI